MKKTLLLSTVLCAALTSLVAWEVPSLESVGSVVGGIVPHGDKVVSALKVGKAGMKAAEEITPEQEYYIGRAVSATILSKYKLYKDKNLNDYVSKIGILLTLHSKMPYTYNGYNFAILDSDEINAFATPSGMIFITKGMINICDSEDALASVLAHEIGHVQNRHGINSIEKGRITSFLSVAATEGAKQYAGGAVGELTSIFENSINDIVTTMVTNGYSRAFEYEADKDAVEILKSAGYKNDKIITMLENMKKGLEVHSGGFGDTHPAPQDRIDELKNSVKTSEDTIPSSRSSRFSDATKKL